MPGPPSPPHPACETFSALSPDSPVITPGAWAAITACGKAPRGCAKVSAGVTSPGVVNVLRTAAPVTPATASCGRKGNSTRSDLPKEPWPSFSKHPKRLEGPTNCLQRYTHQHSWQAETRESKQVAPAPRDALGRCKNVMEEMCAHVCNLCLQNPDHGAAHVAQC